jgi:hypothetical protein
MRNSSVNKVTRLEDREIGLRHPAETEVLIIIMMSILTMASIQNHMQLVMEAISVRGGKLINE